MSESLTPLEENSFLSRARYPKGKRSLQAILDATYEIVTSEGLMGASQEAIARRAKVTQSAVRHYFPTKEELLLAFFTVGVERLQSVVDTKMAEAYSDARTKLLEVAATHLDWIMSIEDIYYFESAAFWGRNPGYRSLRENWYQGITRKYRDLISEIHPTWSHRECESSSFQVLTLILGSWTTLGATRPILGHRKPKTLKAMTLAGINQLISDKTEDNQGK